MGNPYDYNAELVVELRKCDECGHEWEANRRRRLHTDRPECPRCYHRGPKIRDAVRRTWTTVKRTVQAYQCKHCLHVWRPNLRSRRPDVAGSGVTPPHCPACRRTAL